MAKTETELQESSQALFCAVADFLGYNEAKIAFDTKKHPTYADLLKYTTLSKKPMEKIIEEAYDKDHTSLNRRIPLKTINTFLNKEEWYRSTVKIALKVVEKVNTISTKFAKIRGANWADIFYVRGDKDVFASIKTLFDRANKYEKDRETQKPIRVFGAIDKWCPADIYFASDAGALKLRTEAKLNKDIQFDYLNTLVGNLIKTGDLLPLSLKKQPDNVYIHKVNFNRNKERAKVVQNYKYCGNFGNKRLGLDKLTEKDLGGAPLRIKMNETGSGMFQIRHTKDNALKGEIVLPSGEARGGSVTGNQIARIIEQVDPKFAALFQKTWIKCKGDFAQRKREIDKKYSGDTLKKMTIDASHTLVGEVLNKLVFNYLEKNKGKGKKSDKFIVALYLYAASMSPDSSKHIVAK